MFRTGFVCQVTAPGAEAKNSSSSRFRVTSCVSIAGTEMEQPKRWKNAADFAVENGLNRHFWAPSWGGSYVAGSGCVLKWISIILSSYRPAFLKKSSQLVVPFQRSCQGGFMNMSRIHQPRAAAKFEVVVGTSLGGAENTSN